MADYTQQVRGEEMTTGGGQAMTSNTKDALHRLVDRLPEGEVHAAHRFLEFLAGAQPGVEASDRQYSLGDAPEEDEDLSAAEEAALAEALARRARGEARYVVHQDARRALGW